MRRLCDEAEIPLVCVHSLRGLHATLATEAGATSHAVAGALGHSTPALTQAHYIDSSAKRRASSKRVVSALAPAARAHRPRRAAKRPEALPEVEVVAGAVPSATDETTGFVGTGNGRRVPHTFERLSPLCKPPKSHVRTGGLEPQDCVSKFFNQLAPLQ
jgi:hypothetical protein